uniref:ARAD1B03102p n=1 Tax=Blastobotrys adeninivorans TaxID=409370 RepID=A0A060T5A8_BLAAD
MALSQSGLGAAEKSLRQIVWQSLDLDCLDSAEFACQRLVALDASNNDSVHLMGLVLFRQRRYKSAADLTANVPHIGCAYIHAKCCVELETPQAGIEGLEAVRNLWPSSKHNVADGERMVLPNSRALNEVLGRLHELNGDKKAAVQSYAGAITANPFIWGPIESISRMGVALRTDSMFKPEALRVGNEEISNGGAATSDPFGPNSASSVASSSTAGGGALGPPGASNTVRPTFTFKTGQNFLRNRLPATPTTATTNDDNSSMPNDDAFSTPSDGRRAAVALPLAPQKRSSRNISTSGDGSKPVFEIPRRQIHTTVKRTARGGASSSNTTNLTSASTASTASTSSSSSASSSAPGAGGTSSLKRTASGRLSGIHEAEQYLCALFRDLASAQVNFSRYQCSDAVKTLSKLSPAQRDTPFVLSMLGRLHFELVNYEEAYKIFQRLRSLDRNRVKDMEYFSTLLWHLRKDVELSFLAHELIDIDRKSPQAWCALGNSFSLQRETDQALKCFKRAIQLDPKSPYAYTLQAHEYVASDAYENAQDSFRLAIRADNRHYNAWYGLGMVFMRLGNVDMAELHFNRAITINPSNVVLICCIGMVLEKKSMHAEALDQYTRACELQPKSALSLYRRARALINLRMYNAALVEFDKLCTLAPDEASVHFLLGQLYKILQNFDLAIKHFTIALNLDPKGSHLIKEALSTLTTDPNLTLPS